MRSETADEYHRWVFLPENYDLGHPSPLYVDGRYYNEKVAVAYPADLILPGGKNAGNFFAFNVELAIQLALLSVTNPAVNIIRLIPVPLLIASIKIWVPMVLPILKIFVCFVRRNRVG